MSVTGIPVTGRHFCLWEAGYRNAHTMIKFLPKSKISRLFFALLLSLIVSLAVVSVRHAGGLESVELLAYDFYLRLDRKSAAPDERIVLIKITEADIKKRGHWPMTDAEVADTLALIARYKPSVIGFDLYRDIPVSPGKEKLVKVFSQENIVSVRKIGDDLHSGISGPYVVQRPDRVGFNDLVTDADGAIRRGLLFLDDGKTVYSSFSLLLAVNYLKERGIGPEPGEKNPQYLKLGKTTFLPLMENSGGYAGADMRGYQYMLDFRGLPFNSFSIADLEAKRFPAEALLNKIVIIGSTAESLKDFFYTPLSKSQGSEEFTYGIMLHALMTSQLIRSALGESKPLAFAEEGYELGWIIVWGLIGGLLGLLSRPFWRFLFLLLVTLLVIIFVTYFAFTFGWWIPLVPPLLAWFVSTFAVTGYVSYVERTERNILMQLFSKHVSQGVAEAIWEERDKFMYHGRPQPKKLIATVLFTDLKDFTSVSERLDPRALMDWLNEYMDAMTRVIMKHGGTINKYIGDSIMAVFGVPLPREAESEVRADAMNAVTCALEMGAEVARLNGLWKERNLPSVYMRIGISTGPLVAGCLGGSERMEYTVIGDTVNIASRLESFGKEENSLMPGSRPWRILIGEETLKCLNNQFETTSVGVVALKGKEEKTGVHLVTSRTG